MLAGEEELDVLEWALEEFLEFAVTDEQSHPASIYPNPRIVW